MKLSRRLLQLFSDLLQRRWQCWSKQHHTPATTGVTCCYHGRRTLLQPPSCFATTQKTGVALFFATTGAAVLQPASIFATIDPAFRYNERRVLLQRRNWHHVSCYNRSLPCYNRLHFLLQRVLWFGTISTSVCYNRRRFCKSTACFCYNHFSASYNRCRVVLQPTKSAAWFATTEAAPPCCYRCGQGCDDDDLAPTTATCCGAPARPTEGEVGGTGGQRARVAQPCGRPASAASVGGQGRAGRWSLSPSFSLFFCYEVDEGIAFPGRSIQLDRVARARPAEDSAGAPGVNVSHV